jgi:ribosomal protection tetracycline resistance protein
VEALGPTLPVLARLHVVSHTPTIQGSSCTLEGDIPAARVH